MWARELLKQTIMPPASTRPETRPTLPAAVTLATPSARERPPRRRTVTVWIGDMSFQALVV
jgi:hypothetical protein